MKLALISDIHANRQALQACLAHARQQGADQFAFLGDLVGYGADPAAVLDDMGLGGDYIRRELCTDEFVDTIDSSVGEMKQVYALLEFNESQDAMLIDRARSYSRQEGLQDVSLIGGGLLASVATLFGLLKVDTWTRGYYTKRLFLGVPAAIITVLALLLAAGTS